MTGSYSKRNFSNQGDLPIYHINLYAKISGITLSLLLTSMGGLIETFKGYYNKNCENFFTRSTVHHTRGHNKQQSRLNLKIKLFTQIVNRYSCLSISSYIDSIALFKQNLITTGPTLDVDTNKGLVPNIYNCIL